MNAPMINIGVPKETVVEAHKAIIDILKSNVDQATMVVALNTLHTICHVNNTSINNCDFESTEK